MRKPASYPKTRICSSQHRKQQFGTFELFEVLMEVNMISVRSCCFPKEARRLRFIFWSLEAADISGQHLLQGGVLNLDNWV